MKKLIFYFFALAYSFFHSSYLYAESPVYGLWSMNAQECLTSKSYNNVNFSQASSTVDSLFASACTAYRWSGGWVYKGNHLYERQFYFVNTPTYLRKVSLSGSSVKPCPTGQTFDPVTGQCIAPQPTPTPAPQEKCSSITGKSFYGSQKGTTSQDGCINGCATTASSCAYFPPVTADSIVTCKYLVTGFQCPAGSPSVQVGTPETTPPPQECANYYIDKTGKKICVNGTTPTMTPISPTSVPPTVPPTPWPTDASGNPIIDPNGSSGSGSNPSGYPSGGGTGGGTSTTSVPGTTQVPGTTPVSTPVGTPAPTSAPSGDVPNLPDKLYSSKETRTFSSVLDAHVNKMKTAPIINAASSYFTINVSGTCPTWVIPSVMGMPSIAVDQFCNQTAFSLYAIIKIVLLIGCSIIAFRIAVLD